MWTFGKGCERKEMRERFGRLQKIKERNVIVQRNTKPRQKLEQMREPESTVDIGPSGGKDAELVRDNFKEIASHETNCTLTNIFLHFAKYYIYLRINFFFFL